MSKCLDCTKVWATYGGDRPGTVCPFCKSKNIDSPNNTTNQVENKSELLNYIETLKIGKMIIGKRRNQFTLEEVEELYKTIIEDLTNIVR